MDTINQKLFWRRERPDSRDCMSEIYTDPVNLQSQVSTGRVGYSPAAKKVTSVASNAVVLPSHVVAKSNLLQIDFFGRKGINHEACDALALGLFTYNYAAWRFWSQVPQTVRAPPLVDSQRSARLQSEDFWIQANRTLSRAFNNVYVPSMAEMLPKKPTRALRQTSPSFTRYDSCDVTELPDVDELSDHIVFRTRGFHYVTRGAVDAQNAAMAVKAKAARTTSVRHGRVRYPNGRGLFVDSFPIEPDNVPKLSTPQKASRLFRTGPVRSDQDSTTLYIKRLRSKGFVVEFGRKFDLTTTTGPPDLLQWYGEHIQRIKLWKNRSEQQKDKHLVTWVSQSSVRLWAMKIGSLLGDKDCIYVHKLHGMTATKADRELFYTVPQGADYLSVASMMLSYVLTSDPLYVAAGAVAATYLFRRPLKRFAKRVSKQAVEFVLDAAQERIDAVVAPTRDQLAAAITDFQNVMAETRPVIAHVDSFLSQPESPNHFIAQLSTAFHAFKTRLFADLFGGNLFEKAGVAIRVVFILVAIVLFHYFILSVLPNILWSVLEVFYSTLVPGIDLFFLKQVHTDSQETQPQAGFSVHVSDFYNFFSSIVNSMFTMPTPKAPKFGDLLPKMMSFGRSVEYFLEKVPQLLAWLVSWFTGQPVPTNHQEVAVLKLRDAVNAVLLDRSPDGLNTFLANDVRNVHQVTSLVQEYEALSRSMLAPSSKMSVLFTDQVRKMDGNIQSLRTALSKHHHFVLERKLPTWINVSGKPGTGKTLILRELAKAVKSQYYALSRDPRYEGLFTKLDYAVAPNGDPFWDFYMNQRFLIADDLMQNKDPTYRALFGGSWMTINSSETCSLTVSDLRSKGMRYFDSDFILTTTNDPYDVDMPITRPEAFWERACLTLEILSYEQSTFLILPAKRGGPTPKVTLNGDVKKVLTLSEVAAIAAATAFSRDPNASRDHPLYAIQSVTIENARVTSRYVPVDIDAPVPVSAGPQAYGDRQWKQSFLDTIVAEFGIDDEVLVAQLANILPLHKFVISHCSDEEIRNASAYLHDAEHLALESWLEANHFRFTHHVFSKERVEEYLRSRYSFWDTLVAAMSPSLVWTDANADSPTHAYTIYAARVDNPVTFNVYCFLSLVRSFVSFVLFYLSMVAVITTIVSLIVRVITSLLGVASTQASGRFAGGHADTRRKTGVINRPPIKGRAEIVKAGSQSGDVGLFNKLAGNVVKVKFGAASSFALALCHQLYVTPAHCTVNLQPDDIIVFGDDGLNAMEQFHWDQLIVVKAGLPFDSELTFFARPTGPAHKNITHLFSDDPVQNGCLERIRPTVSVIKHNTVVTYEHLKSTSWKWFDGTTTAEGRYINHHWDADLVVHSMDNAVGYCGIPYFTSTGVARPHVVGIHTAGNPSTRTSYVASLPKYLIDEVVSRYVEYTSPTSNDVDLRLEDVTAYQSMTCTPGVQHLGEVPPRLTNPISKPSKLAKGPLHPDVGMRDDDGPLDLNHCPTRRPCNAFPYTNSAGVLLNGPSITLNKFIEVGGHCNITRPPPTHLIEKLDWRPLLPPDFCLTNVRNLTIEEAIRGGHGIESMDLSKSVGYPYSKQGLTRQQVLFSGPDINPVFVQQVQALEARLETHEVPMVALPCTKDELVPNDDYEKGKCRIFVAGELQHIVLVRMYFSLFLQEMCRVPWQTPIAIRLNAHSVAWGQLYHRLSQRCAKAIAGDFKGFEFTIPSWARDLFVRFLDEVYPLDPRHSKIRANLVKSVLRVYYILGKRVLLLNKGEGSGHPITAFFNSWFNWVFHSLAWLNLDSPHRPATMSNMEESLQLTVFGDDSVVGVVDRDDYNMVYLSEFADELGLCYTGPTKKSVEEPYLSWDHVDYLKRGFRIKNGYTFAPLKFSSVVESVMWVSTSSSDQVADTLAAFRSMLCELVHYSKEQYVCYRNLAIRYSNATGRHEIFDEYDTALRRLQNEQ